MLLDCPSDEEVLVIPEGVTTIPDKFFFYAPLDCPPVVHCPNTLLTIAASAFDDYHNLSEIYLGNSL